MSDSHQPEADDLIPSEVEVGTKRIVQDEEGREADKKTKTREMVGRADQLWNPSNRAGFDSHVIFVRRHINAQGLPTGKEDVDIKGPRLKDALKHINIHAKELDFGEDPPKIAKSILYHPYDGLRKLYEEEKEKETPDLELIFELEAGIQFIREEYEETFESRSRLLKTGEITYPILWTLFPPQTMIVHTDTLGQSRAHRVHACAEITLQDGTKYVEIEATHVDSDGHDIGSVDSGRLRIFSFSGKKEISALPYCPIELLPNCEELKAALLDQGKRTMKLHGRQLVEYSGFALKDAASRVVKFNSHGRVMLDPETFNKTQKDLSEMEVPEVEVIKPKDLTNEHITMMNPMVFGFSLGDKFFGVFAVSQITDVKWNDEIFDSLVLDRKQRDFVHDLVQAHQALDEPGFDDVVRDKGRGLIGLLSGPPGVGKTLTAEAIAEVTRRPLCMISSGELGSNPDAINDRLFDVLELAELWHALLLLDEADVFLAARNDVDLTRNATVSVFLRELEYYQGILILTINRLKSMDQAFQSRIHFCLNYTDLDIAGCETVWRNFINKAEKSNAKLQVKLNDDDIKELTKMVLNGRTIRNVVSISQAVAVKRQEDLTLESIRAAFQFAQNFDGALALGIV